MLHGAQAAQAHNAKLAEWMAFSQLRMGISRGRGHYLCREPEGS